MSAPAAYVQPPVIAGPNEPHALAPLALTLLPSSNVSDPFVHFPSMRRAPFLLAVLLMAGVVVASNLLVQFALNNWLTWGALSYPFAFLLADLLNRRWGPAAARRVAWAGFGAAVLVSVWVATPRIAAASGAAFICAQLVDIGIFHRLRDRAWWRAPFISGVLAAVFDTAIFFFIAFVGTNGPWVTWALGDMMIKLALNLFMLAPFRVLMWNIARPTARPREYT
jgi:uncharacterized PurR-regulated membrane protein YhhQ (DUF165 family)